MICNSDPEFWAQTDQVSSPSTSSFLPFHKEQFILFYFICNEKSMLKVIYHLHLDLLQLSHEITFTIPRYIQDFHFVGQVPQFHFHPTRS